VAGRKLGRGGRYTTAAESQDQATEVRIISKQQRSVEGAPETTYPGEREVRALGLDLRGLPTYWKSLDGGPLWPLDELLARLGLAGGRA
jgi:hypothetical protein